MLALPICLLLAVPGTVVYLVTTAALFALGVWLSDRAAAALGRHDHPAIVWDEVVGMLVTMIGAPATWEWLLAGFLLFRLFDITKPWPINVLDRRVGGGLGIMLDDLLAGLLAAGVLGGMRLLLG